MKVHILRVINEKITKAFEDLLLTGAFPEVRFENGGHHGFKSYSLFEYSDLHATFTKLVDKRIREQLGDINGVFTRKHSAKFLEQVYAIIDGISVADLKGTKDRFHSFADDLRGYARDEILGKTEDNGEFVACDFCNGGEDTLGGVLIGSYAICGDCAKDITHPEEIDEVFDPAKKFRQNVLEYRKRVYGKTEAEFSVTSY
jgi:hypothetical protein